MSQIGWALVALLSAAWLGLKALALLIVGLGLWLVPVACTLSLLARPTLGARGGYAQAMTAVQVAAMIMIAIAPLVMWMLSALPRGIGLLALLPLPIVALAFAMRAVMRDEHGRPAPYWLIAGWSAVCWPVWYVTTGAILLTMQEYFIHRPPGMPLF